MNTFLQVIVIILILIVAFRFGRNIFRPASMGAILVMERLFIWQ